MILTPDILDYFLKKHVLLMDRSILAPAHPRARAGTVEHNMALGSGTVELDFAPGAGTVTFLSSENSNCIVK